MSSSSTLFDGLNQVSAKRQQAIATFTRLIDTITQAETASEKASGTLGLERQITLLRSTRESLAQGTFRLLILGDMKRGKSTFLNALLGERILPSDVNPCTALLTLVKYGPEKTVTIHFNDGSDPDVIDFATFKQQYTIDPTESKALEDRHEQAFPNVSHAVVSYPLPLLQQGLEFIDTPGLNDTEARNKVVLDYLDNCHAVLFLLSAVQPLTLDERRYLNNSLKGRGISLFFLVNEWDRLRTNLVDPDDAEALATAENSVRKELQTQLKDYCSLDEDNIYSQRVFEISALQALRQRLKANKLADTSDINGPEGNSPEGNRLEPDWGDTGFAEFLGQLQHFLVKERMEAELGRVGAIARQVQARVTEAIDRRIPLLQDTKDDLKERIDSVQTEFEMLSQIRDRYRELIREMRDRNAKAIADSFKDYILKLETTFEADFVASQPDLDFISFLSQDNRNAFQREFRRAFERYINDRLAAWEFMAKQDLSKAFTELQENARNYQDAYGAAVEAMQDKLLGGRYYAPQSNDQPKAGPVWAEGVQELFDTIPDSLNSTVGRFNLFWQQVLQGVMVYVCISIALSILSIIFSSLVFNILGVLAVGGGLLAVQAEVVRQQFLSETRRQFAKHLPQIAEDQWRPVYRAVERVFDTYEEEIIGNITQDIQARKQELDSLLAQKESRLVDQDTEIQRLNRVKSDMASATEFLLYR
ncbi:MAG: dynamin family protein [Cyanobacteria bacterium P01_F01_bin.150]